MNYMVAYHTDIGLRKSTNQDSIAVKMMDTPAGRAVLAIVCDGMGGLSAGELASKEVIQAYAHWFDTEFAKDAAQGAGTWGKIIESWRSLAVTENTKLGIFGARRNAGLGTTLSAMLIYGGQYLIIHVGDSRIYEMTANGAHQVTEDQSLVAREVAAGRITEEEAQRDPRRSVLLQCIGASPQVEPSFYQGKVAPNTTYLLCSDGFCHEVSLREIFEKLGPNHCENPTQMKEDCVMLTELVKDRDEQDNISMIVLKVEA